MHKDIDQEIYDFMRVRGTDRPAYKLVNKKILTALYDMLSSDAKRGSDAKIPQEVWWIEASNEKIDTLSRIYSLCSSLGYQSHYAEVLDQSLPSEIIIAIYMQDYSYFFPNLSDAQINSSLKSNLDIYGNQVLNTQCDNRQIVLETKIGKITYCQATDKYLNDDSDMLNIVLYHRQVNGSFRCHELSYDLTCKLKANCVTGFVPRIGGEVLHSWVEKDEDCIDIAHNIVLNKNDFYRLYHPEVWNELTYDEIENQQIAKVISNPEFLKGYYSLPYYAIKKQLLKSKKM